MLPLSRGFAMNALKSVRESGTGNGKDAREVHLKTHYGERKRKKYPLKSDTETSCSV